MKKFISMALALVMTLSLCTFISVPEAEAFTDTGELSQYAQQAIDVIKTIEVMDGVTADEFSPGAKLTRQAAAKVICNMILGPVTAKALPTNESPFPDVAAGGTFTGYIAYCSHEGIINGYSDGTFKPNGVLTGYAFLKMLLGALGYDGSANAEGFVGGNWKVNVAKIALGIGLNDGITSDPDGENLDQGVTREDAAIYAFNTLQGDLVEYPSQNSININGVVVSMGNGKATPQTWNTSSTNANNINNRTSDGANARPIVQFAERYFDKLRRQPNVWDTYTPDDFGRPSIKWFWKGVEIGTYSRDPDATFVGNVKVNAIYEALGMTSGNDTANLYINSGIPNNERLNVARGNDKDLDHATNLLMDRTSPATANTGRSLNTYGDGTHRVDRIGDGTLIECYRNDANNHVDVCVISVYGGKVSAVKGATSKKDAYVTIEYSNDANHRPDSISNPNSGNNEYETEDFDEDDVVAYTYSDSAQSIKGMYRMEAESGTLTSRVSSKNLKLDSDVYSYGKEYTFNDMTEADLSSKSSYVVYLDENGYVLWVEEDEFAVDQYVLLERITIETTANNITTKTASVIGTAQTNVYADGVNDTAYQVAFNQSKDAVGNSTWDAQAQVRFSNGTRRTVTLDDSKNYRTDSTSDALALAAVNGGATSYTDLTNNSGNGNGNWIASDFTAGRILRLTSTSSGYKLHRLDNKYVFSVANFSLNSKKVYTTVGGVTSEVTIPATGTRLLIDSETHFVVEDTTNGTYKSYIGSKNVPDIKANLGTDIVTAYVYHRGDLAKLVYITKADNVSSSSNDIIFMAANSTSNLVDSDDGYYYDVSAVVKNEVTTLRVRRGTTLTMLGRTFTPGADGNKKEDHCVILNNVTYDTNDLVISGYFDSAKVSASRAHGIRRVNDEEIRLDTFGSSYLRDVSESIRVYYVDGSDIEEIGYEDIVNDTMDWVYYVEDDGVITYLFIVDYDGDDSTTSTYALNTSLPAGYSVTSLPTTIAAGDVLSFQVLVGGVPQTSATVSVALQYTSSTTELTVTEPAAETSTLGLWNVTVPSGIKADTPVTFVVTPV